MVLSACQVFFINYRILPSIKSPIKRRVKNIRIFYKSTKDSLPSAGPSFSSSSVDLRLTSLEARVRPSLSSEDTSLRSIVSSDPIHSDASPPSLFAHSIVPDDEALLGRCFLLTGSQEQMAIRPPNMRGTMSCRSMFDKDWSYAGVHHIYRRTGN